jgi:hypothetical protein
MAQRVQILLVCDVHDDDITPGTETIPFALDGTSYEIDVCDEHGAELRDVLAAFVAAARRTGGRSARRAASTGRSTPRAAAGSASARQQAGDIRAWARSQGLNVNERGRIPASIVEQYHAAH